MASKRKRNRNRHPRDEERRFTVRGIRRNPPDVGKLSAALISLAMAEAERQAQAEHAEHDTGSEAATEDHSGSGGEING